MTRVPNGEKDYDEGMGIDIFISQYHCLGIVSFGGGHVMAIKADDEGAVITVEHGFGGRLRFACSRLPRYGEKYHPRAFFESFSNVYPNAGHLPTGDRFPIFISISFSNNRLDFSFDAPHN